MIILGIDPGSNVMGYGVVEKNGNSLKHIENGSIVMKKEPLTKKLDTIFTTLKGVIDRYKPQYMSIENVFYGKNVQSTIKLSHARAIPILVAQLNGLDVYEFTPLEVKKSIVGYGRAEKHQVENMVKMLLNIDQKIDPDPADALALAITFAHFPSFDRDKHKI